MAAGTESTGQFRGGRSLWWRRLKGRVFEATLVAATLFGIAALVAIFALIGLDALGPQAASPTWYLVYLGTLVGPLAAHTLYVRYRPTARAVSALAYPVVFGGLAAGLAGYTVAIAFGPHNVSVTLLTALLPPLAVLGYGRRFGQNRYTGPAVPVATVAGIAVGALVHGPASSALAFFADWVLFVLVVTVPVAGALGVLARRRLERDGWVIAALVVAGATAIGAASVVGAITQFTPLFVVLYSTVLAPGVFLVADTAHRRRDGWVGLLGPVVLVGGTVAGALIERSLGIVGLDSWLTPTLLLDSWSTFRPEEAGVYPQIVGSIMIVGTMALLAFPVGVGAAIYLEEYAPSTGWVGRLTGLLDVNISNLAGVPSVVYGLLGLALFRRAGGLGPGMVIAGGATLGLLILPIVIVSAQEALRSVPDELRQGSYGLGASKWQTVRNVVLPRALPGILTGTILALGRAIGETAPLVMIGVATTKFSAPNGLFAGATALPLQIFAAKGSNIPEYRTGVVAATALVLLVLLLVMNGTAILIRNRFQSDRQRS